MPEYVAHYRALAARMRDIASRSTDAVTKAELLSLAERFESLASFRERKLKAGEAADD